MVRRDCSVRTAAYATKMKTVQMNMAEGERDLQCQRRKRQQRTAPLMAMNQVHLIPTTYPNIMLPLP